ncbi:MAG: N-6 DNA methylase [Ancrocorticia sp.]
MTSGAALSSVPPALAQDRKARGAFFTPAPIAEFMVRWAVRSLRDRVMDPSCGDAAFLLPAARHLTELAAVEGARGPAGERSSATFIPHVHGVDIHEPTAAAALEAIAAAGGTAHVTVDDFFNVAPSPRFDAIVGNPPYIRYQGFTGIARTRAREAALRAGVSLTALASSWAAFVIHASQFLVPGGRLAFVLPAELLSVNYAGPVRRFLFEHFGNVELIMFEHQVFPDAEADVVLLMASNYGGRTASAVIRQVPDETHLDDDVTPLHWAPLDPTEKWTGLLVEPEAQATLSMLVDGGLFVSLSEWGDTKLGAVTGGNQYFALSPERVKELGLTRRDLVRVSPPGSSHLRGLELSSSGLGALSRAGKATWLFYPKEPLSRAAAEYVEAGQRAGVNQAYKCRVRTPWYKVPLLAVPDLFLTCMNADTPRLTTNSAGAHHLNSIHGVYLQDGVTELGRELLPLASLNSATLLHAEVTGRSYGGGILKLEPREASVWMMPSAALVASKADALRSIRSTVSAKLAQGKLLEAVTCVDEVLFGSTGALPAPQLEAIRMARESIANRRTKRGRKNGR